MLMDWAEVTETTHGLGQIVTEKVKFVGARKRSGTKLDASRKNPFI